MQGEKDRWDKLEVVAKLIGAGSVLVVGLAINLTLKDRELQAQYVNLALQVLQRADTATHAAPQREYAVAILDKYSPVRMSDELRRGLRTGEHRLPPIMVIEGEFFHLPEPIGWDTLVAKAIAERIAVDTLRAEPDTLR